MLENPNNSDLPCTFDNLTTSIKPYAPPSQKNRSLGRRKSGGRGGEKNQIGASRNLPIADHQNAGRMLLPHEYPHTRLISLRGCCDGEAFQLLNDRWEAAMDAYRNPNPSADLAERPVMYSGSGEPAHGHFKLPHQMINRPASVGASALRLDFLSELKRAMQNADPKF